eukprot:scaffold37_cov346-Pavlova_lutheri.AAC.14
MPRCRKQMLDSDACIRSFPCVEKLHTHPFYCIGMPSTTAVEYQVEARPAVYVVAMPLHPTVRQFMFVQTSISMSKTSAKEETRAPRTNSNKPSSRDMYKDSSPVCGACSPSVFDPSSSLMLVTERS